MILVFIMIYIHMANLKSIGVPYTQSITANKFWDLKNVVVRVPITTLEKRNSQQQKDGGQTK